MEEETQSTRVITLEVDVGATSSMFCCMICQELIQSASNHRQCASRPGGDGCGGTICVPCISNLQKRHCPICGDKYPGVFVACPIIKKVIYPQVSQICRIAKCGRSFLTEDFHTSECEWRVVACPVCNAEVQITSIHEHLNESCSLPWGECDIQSMRTTKQDESNTWENTLISVCANPIVPGQLTSSMCRFRFNPAGEPVTNTYDRMLYAWCTSDHVKFMCIQLGAAAGETQLLAVDDDSQKITCPINSFAHFPGAVEFRIEEFLNNDLTAGLGIWNMRIGAHYEIKTGDENDPMLPDFISRNFRDIGTFRGRLLEVIWGPPRGVFVNNSGQTYMMNLDANTMGNIKCLSNIPIMRPGTQDSMIISSTPGGIGYVFSMLPSMYRPAGTQSIFRIPPRSEQKTREEKLDLPPPETPIDEGDSSEDDASDPRDSNMINPGRLMSVLSGEPVPAQSQRIDSDGLRVGDMERPSRTYSEFERAMMHIDIEMLDAAIAASMEEH